MKPIIKITTLALFPVVMLSVSGCMDKSMKGTEQVDVIDLDNGAIIMATVTISATVVAKDMTKGTVTLASDAGGKDTFKVGKDVPDISNINVGDRVTAVVTEEVAVFVGVDVPDSVAAAGGVMVSPDGAGGTIVATMQVTGVVAAVDVKKHKVTFKLEDGSSKTVKVNKDLDLALLPVGETVTVQVGQAVAVSLEK